MFDYIYIHLFMFIHCNLYQQSQCHYAFFCKTSLYSMGWNSFGCWKKSMFLSYPELYLHFFWMWLFSSIKLHQHDSPIEEFFFWLIVPALLVSVGGIFSMRIPLKNGLNRAPSRLEDQFWGFWGWVSFEKWKHGKKVPCFGCGLLTVTVTTRIIIFLVGDPYKPSFANVTGKGPPPSHVRVN